LGPLSSLWPHLWRQNLALLNTSELLTYIVPTQTHSHSQHTPSQSHRLLYLPLWNYHSKASKLQTSTIHIFNTSKLHCSNDKIIMLHSPETLFNVSNLQISSDSKTPWLYSTKVHIYLEYHRVCPLVGLRLPTPSPANECAPTSE